MDNFKATLCSYLDGENSAPEILNDLLEEEGRERIVEDGDLAQRLSVVLTKILPHEQAQLLACDFAEHVMGQIKITRRGREKILRALGEKRHLIGRDPARARLRAMASDVLTGWERNNESESRAVWAVWAALMNLPHHVAKSAQAAAEDELYWQIEHTKQAILAS